MFAICCRWHTAIVCRDPKGFVARISSSGFLLPRNRPVAGSLFRVDPSPSPSLWIRRPSAIGQANRDSGRAGAQPEPPLRLGPAMGIGNGMYEQRDTRATHRGLKVGLLQKFAMKVS